MNKRQLLACALTLVLAVCASVFAMNRKEGWHIDEIATLGLANGSQNGYITAYDDALYGRGAFIKDVFLGDSLRDAFENAKTLIGEVLEKGLRGVNIRERYLAYRDKSAPVWKSGEEFLAFLSAEEGFSLRDVYVNQILDTHPPIYYLLVRAAYSIYALFAGEAFSLWPAYFVNLLFLIGCVYWILRVGQRRFDSPALGIGAALLFSLSAAGLGTGAYLRMYMALTFFVLWQTDLLLEWARADWRLSKSLGRRLTLAVALGFLTHYYFAIYALAAAFVCACALIARGRVRELFRYIGRMATAVILTLIVWPFSVVHLLFSNRGAQALGEAVGAGVFARLADSWKLFSGYLFGGWLIIPAALAAALLTAALLNRRTGERLEGGGLAILVICPAALYFLIVSAIAPYTDLRYVACALPGFALAAAYCLRSLTKALPVSKGLGAGLATAVSVALAGASLLAGEPPFLYTGAARDKAFAADNAGRNCVYVASTGASFYREMPDFRFYNRILIVSREEIPLLAADETLADSDEIVLYIHDSYSQTELMREILESSPYSRFVLLADSSPATDSRAYLLSKE